MAKNILKIVEQNPQARIIVLTGFMHGYYIINELKKQSIDKKIVVKEFYQ